MSQPEKQPPWPWPEMIGLQKLSTSISHFLHFWVENELSLLPKQKVAIG